MWINGNGEDDDGARRSAREVVWGLKELPTAQRGVVEIPMEKDRCGLNFSQWQLIGTYRTDPSPPNAEWVPSSFLDIFLFQ